MEKKCENARFSLLWLDLEMSGLNPERDVILEVAVVTTNTSLDCTIEGPNIVINQPKSSYDHMDQWCYEHHTASGLIKAVEQSKITLTMAEDLLIAFVKKYCVEDRLLFAGNSVYQDRAFLRKYMPRFDALGYYRLIDVSTIKELVHAWYPKDPQADFKKKKNHRALDDVYETIAELAHYQRFFFKEK